LLDAIDFLEERRAPQPHTYKPAPPQPRNAPDFSHVRGQDNAKRALTIAAAGGHNLLMIGPPGVGKSLLAQALVGILPKMELQESIEATKVWSAAGLDPQGLLNARPFRAPHQTATLPAVIGGGQDPKPGEISLAHRGILFLDEFPEFPRQVLEALRAPMEDGVVHVARAKTSLAFPAKFTLVAAMNPCPCGYYGDPEKECRCSAYDVIRYQKKISGPLLDRIDLQMKIPRVHLADLRAASPEKLVSPVIREAVEAARDRQRERFAAARLHITTNAEMNSQQTEKLIAIEPQGEQFLSTLDRARLSPRGYYRLLKTARTIADIETKEKVSAEHLAEAYSYRLRET
jgi:magnesium chelatase family protein